ncbi:MAG: hypothetical protein JNK91_01915 [Ferruginibacter sp.]|nr:hypothetical protein [Ferruginibacter sp.]
MFLPVVLFLTLLVWSVLVGQSYMYAIALTDVSRSLDAASYIRFRQRTDANFRAKYTWVVYAAMLLTPILCVLAWQGGWLLFGASLLALKMLALDILLTIRGNMPINKRINGWTVENYPADWEQYRSKWLSVYAKRQIVTIIGFAALLAGAVFNNG